MSGLRIILDRSVVFRLNNFEADALDRISFKSYPILADEILADLTKEPNKPKGKSSHRGE